MAVRDQLTSATAELMRRYGVAGTGVADILKQSGVARRSIYLNFPGGKAELVCATTRTSGAAITTIMRKLMRAPDPIGAFAEMWSSVLVDSDFDAGCPVVAAALGRHSAPEATDVAVEVFEDWRAVSAERLVADGVDPQLADSLAITIVAAIEGAVIMAQAERSTRPLLEVAARLNDLVAAHLPASSPRVPGDA